ERAQADAPHVFHRAHVCDANDDGRENDRGDHHLHELDETVAERLHRRGSFRRDEPDNDPKRDADEDLEVEARIEWLPRRARHSPTYCVPVRRVGYLIPSCSRYDLYFDGS